MKFLRLNDYLLKILFEDQDIIAIDKPYGINSHTNDSKTGNEEFIHEGLIEIFEKQLGQRLHIVHRLDQTTTGVIIFAKSVESAKKYADYFFKRDVKKTYLFITSKKSLNANLTIELPIIHKGKELTARTEFKFLKENSHFHLWEAHPFTGRNHQIRIHAQAAQLSLLGDTKYGGDPYAFICLHNRRIEFPNGIIIESNAPRYFEDLNHLSNPLLSRMLFEVDRRQRLFQQNAESKECFRLAHNKNDSKEMSFNIDQLGHQLVINVYSQKWNDEAQQTINQLSRILNKPILIRHRVEGKISQPTNSDSEWIVNEGSIQYELRPDQGQSFGLFTDQRLQRHWILNHSKDKSVLNLFSYTGGYSIAAARGGAKDVLSIDSNKNILAWSKRNFELNQIPPDKYKFYCRDVLDFLDQSIKKVLTYDTIICDPPAFSRGEKTIFKIENQIEEIIRKCMQCLNTNGVLLFSTHFEEFTVDDIRKVFEKVKNELKRADLEINYIQAGLDYELVGQRTILKSFLIRNQSSFKELGIERKILDIDED